MLSNLRRPDGFPEIIEKFNQEGCLSWRNFFLERSAFGGLKSLFAKESKVNESNLSVLPAHGPATTSVFIEDRTPSLFRKSQGDRGRFNCREASKKAGAYFLKQALVSFPVSGFGMSVPASGQAETPLARSSFHKPFTGKPLFARDGWQCGCPEYAGAARTPVLRGSVEQPRMAASAAETSRDRNDAISNSHCR
jgi:hypothetical protein